MHIYGFSGCLWYCLKQYKLYMTICHLWTEPQDRTEKSLFRSCAKSSKLDMSVTPHDFEQSIDLYGLKWSYGCVLHSYCMSALMGQLAVIFAQEGVSVSESRFFAKMTAKCPMSADRQYGCKTHTCDHFSAHKSILYSKSYGATLMSSFELFAQLRKGEFSVCSYGSAYRWYIGI